MAKKKPTAKKREKKSNTIWLFKDEWGIQLTEFPDEMNPGTELMKVEFKPTHKVPETTLVAL
jgi:hypothetical protein